MRLAESSGLCSCCYNHDPDKRYIDFDVAFDGAPVLDRETGTIAVQPWDGMQGSHDDLLLCESCVREAAEMLALKPELHSRQYREIERLAVENNGLRDMVRRLQRQVSEVTDAKIGPPQRGRPRKEPVGA